MKMLLLIFTLLFFAPVADAQDIGFFIPQKTLDAMNSPERLPPVRVRRPVAANPQARPQNNVPTASATTAATPSRPRVVAPANNQSPSKTATTAPVAQPVVPTHKTQPQQKPAADVARRQEAPKPRPADEPMVPQTGTPAIPVTADDIADNTPPTTPPQAPTVTTNTPNTGADSNQTPEQQDYARLIKEYEEDIKKISRNLPVENKRLNEMLKNYKDEVLIYN